MRQPSKTLPLAATLAAAVLGGVACQTIPKRGDWWEGKPGSYVVGFAGATKLIVREACGGGGGGAGGSAGTSERGGTGGGGGAGSASSRVDFKPHDPLSITPQRGDTLRVEIGQKGHGGKGGDASHPEGLKGESGSPTHIFLIRAGKDTLLASYPGAPGAVGALGGTSDLPIIDSGMNGRLADEYSGVGGRGGEGGIGTTPIRRDGGFGGGTGRSPIANGTNGEIAELCSGGGGGGGGIGGTRFEPNRGGDGGDGGDGYLRLLIIY